MKTFKIPSVFMAVDKISATMNKMFASVKNFANKSEAEMAKFERRLRSVSETSKKVAQKSAIVGLALAAPLIIAARDAIAFEDRMADVAKTTGLAGVELNKFGKDLLNMAPDTRTPIHELQQIAAIGGQMGVAKTELLGFTGAVDKFNVALGSDFGGGVEEATRAISGLRGLFKETRGMDVAQAITRTGSAINALSAKGVLVPEMTEFTARMGQLPDAIKPSQQAVIALAGVFNKAGITAEIASRGVSDILLTAAQNLPKFAKTMGMTTDAANKLIKADPAAFLVKFSESLKGMDAVKLSKTLKALKVGDIGAIKAVGALGSSTKMLAEFQKITNDEFARGASLLDEYNVKNNTTAGNVQKAMNNFKALSITIGTELLPVINDMLKQLMPVIKSMVAWAQANPKTVKTILMVVAGLSALSLIVSAVSTVISVVTAAQWAWNIAMMANPIGLIIAAVVLFIAEMALLVTYFDEIGAAWLMMMGPIGWIIQLIRTFSKEWANITAAFDRGFIDGIIQIGKTLVEFLLWPLQQILNLVAAVTGADWAANAASSLEAFRKDFGVNLDKPTNPGATEAAVNKSITEEKQTVGIMINDKTGRASVENGNQLNIPVHLSTTWGGNNYGR
jgi:TP901 family phage tail tape measure protein